MGCGGGHMRLTSCFRTCSIALLVLLSFGAVGRGPPPEEPKQTARSLTRPSTKPAAPANPELSPLLDAALSDWLSHRRDQRINAEPRVAILLSANLPAGYVPHVAGWTVVAVEEDDPRSPPESAVAGDTAYRFHIRSSYARTPTAQKDLSKGDPPSTRPATLPARTVEITDPPVLRIKRLHVDGTSGEVELEQNLHHNLGGSGGTYKASKTDGRWRCTLGEVWKS